MGKTKRIKIRSKVNNPTGIPSLHDLKIEKDFMEEEVATDGPVASIIDQLQSISVEEKHCGLQTLATLAQHNRHLVAIVESDIIRIAAPFLVDPNRSIRQATAGAFRNLSVCGLDTCDYLVDQDILTPLLALLHEYASTPGWVPIFDKTMNNQMDEYADTFLQAVNLVWNLCESSSLALDCFNQSLLIQSFIRSLNFEIFGLDIAIAVAHCLLVISEDNPILWKELNSSGPQFASLLNMPQDDHPHTLLKSLAAAIMSNVPGMAEPNLNLILLGVSKTLAINHRQIVCNLSSALPLSENSDNKTTTHESLMDESRIVEDETDQQATRRRRQDDMPSNLDIEIQKISWLLDAQRIAAETMTNLCSYDEETPVNEMEDDISDAESVHDYDASAHSSSTNLQNSDKLPIEILEAIKSLGLVEKLWQRAQPLPENVFDILKENSSNRNLLKKLKSLRTSSLLCLQNLCNTLTTEDLGGAEGVYNVWVDLGHQIFQSHPDNIVLEASTALMRSALEHLRQSPHLFKQMTIDDLELMLCGVKDCDEPEIRANWLKMLGILGCLLPENLIKLIIIFVIEELSTESDAWAISEALDSLMDMFSDNDWDHLVFELKLSQKAKELEKILKNKMRQQKKELDERYPAVSTVRTNFGRFVKYLENQMKKYKPIAN